jgi:hypothetical protein
MRAVDRSPANLLRAVVELMPGGALITQALDNHGIIDRVAGWVQQQMASLGLVGSSIRQADRFLDSWAGATSSDLGGVWERAKRIVTEPIARITSFVGNLVSGMLQFIRDAVLRPLAGWPRHPRLGSAVRGAWPQPDYRRAGAAQRGNLIGGFMRLIGQEEVWQNIQRGNAVARAWAWFQGALAGLMGFVTALPGQFMDTLRSLGNDLLTPAADLRAHCAGLRRFAGRFFSWAGQQVMSLLEIIFEVARQRDALPAPRRRALQHHLPQPDRLRAQPGAGRRPASGLRHRIGTHLRPA